MTNKEDSRSVTVDTQIPMVASPLTSSGDPLSRHRDVNGELAVHTTVSTCDGAMWFRRGVVALGTIFGFAVIAFVALSSDSTTTPSASSGHRRDSHLDSSLSLAASPVRYRMKQRLPQCIIIGARKCGTRALLEFMNLHPQVAIASEEVHFFDNDSRYSRGLEWYRSQMPESSPEQITVEKSPRYFIDDLTPGRIHDMNSSIKLILILRDPVTRTVSDFAQILSNRRKRGKPVKRFGRLVIDPETKEINTDLRMVTTSMYDRHLENWYRYFKRQQIHIVNGDELVRDPFSQLKQVEDFLGLRHVLRRAQFVFNATKGFYCARKSTGTLCLNKGKGRPHPNVSKRILRKLRRFFNRSNPKIFELTGQHFAWEKLR